MNTRAQLRSEALLWAILLGVLADAIVRVPGRPGVNVALWAVAGSAALVVLLRRRAEAASRESYCLVAGAVAFACALVLRDAEALAVFSVFASVALLMMAAGHAASAWAVRAHLTEIVLSVIRVGVWCAAGPIGWGRAERNPDANPSQATKNARTVGLTIARGTLMALPAVLLVGAMLMSADAVFANMIRNVFHIDIGPLLEHIAFAALIAWLSAGYLRAFMVADTVLADAEIIGGIRIPQPKIAAAEITVALWILNLLFVAFMAVQLRYLFGGAGLVEVTPGLSYADYARRGFFELVATAALVVPILLLADWAAGPETTRSRSLLRATMLVLVVLLVGVIGSAAYRMRLYQDAYGLTEQRLYVSAFIVWLTAVLAWLVVTVLRGHRERFAFGSIIAGLACLFGLHVLNPDALIARVNLGRADVGATYDGRYLGTLSADAVPVILGRLDSLPSAERCRVADMLHKRWGGERPGGWRTWNQSDARARRLVASLDAGPACAASVRSMQPASTPLSGG